MEKKTDLSQKLIFITLLKFSNLQITFHAEKDILKKSIILFLFTQSNNKLYTKKKINKNFFKKWFFSVTIK